MLHREYQWHRAVAVRHEGKAASADQEGLQDRRPTITKQGLN